MVVRLMLLVKLTFLVLFSKRRELKVGIADYPMGDTYFLGIKKPGPMTGLPFLLTLTKIER